MKEPNGWLSVIGLDWLEPGENPFGSDSANAVVFPALPGVPGRVGSFFLEDGVSDVDDRGVVVINYNREGNSFPSRKIRDHVRCIEEQVLYIGRFNYIFVSKPRFLGYFLLSRI